MDLGKGADGKRLCSDSTTVANHPLPRTGSESQFVAVFAMAKQNLQGGTLRCASGR